LVVLVGAGWWFLGRDTSTTDPRNPGRVQELKSELLEHGPRFVKGDKQTASYWLALGYIRGNKAQPTDVLAIYPYIRGHKCKLRPERPVADQPALVHWSEDKACGNGGYSTLDLSKYHATVGGDDTLTVDTSRPLELVAAEE
jgi:hypothetical protein